MLRQIEWVVQNGAITKKGVSSVTTFFLKKIGVGLRTSWFDVSATQMFIVILFVSAGVLFWCYSQLYKICKFLWKINIIFYGTNNGAKSL